MNEVAPPLPSASVVVPTYDRLADLRRVIEAVSEQISSLQTEAEIVVVDDGSTDGTAEVLARSNIPARVIKHRVNRG